MTGATRWRAGALALGVAFAWCALTAATSGANHNTLTLVTPGTPGASSSPVHFSSDGSRVLFTTIYPIVPSDTDGSLDIYERSGPTTTLISEGTTTQIGYNAASEDGTRVLFSSSDQLEGTDTDAAVDIYQRLGSTTTLLTLGPSGGNGPLASSFGGASGDASTVFFRTRESLVSADTDNFINDGEYRYDIYKHSASGTELVSIGPTGGNGPFPADFAGNSLDGTHVYFTTAEPLVAEDTDTTTDLYERAGSTTTLIGSNGPVGATFKGVSQDGAHVFFTTTESLDPDDTDTSQDLYEQSGSTTTLIGSNGALGATYEGASQDGTRVFFTTSEALVVGDTDSTQDVYEQSGSTATLLSTGPTGGNGAFGATFGGASKDGAFTFFTTFESLVPQDLDTDSDLYERSGSVTTLISTGPTAGSGGFASGFGGVSQDGTRVFFGTSEALVPSDTNGAVDVYERFNSTTTLISARPGTASPSGGHALYSGASDDGTKVFFWTYVNNLVPADTDNNYDIYEASVGAGYARPKAATPMYVPLVLAFEPCTAPTGEHAPPLSSGSCAPEQQSSDELTVGTPDANMKVANGTGFVRLKAAPDDPATTADEADMPIDVSVTDVRKLSDLSDYAGELRLRASVRLTDKMNSYNAGEGTEAGTVTDITFGPSIPCTATPDTSIGSTCSITTSVDTLIPGTLRDGARSLLQLGQVDLYDGGADSDGDTVGDNTRFMTQGVFAP